MATNTTEDVLMELESRTLVARAMELRTAMLELSTINKEGNIQQIMKKCESIKESAEQLYQALTVNSGLLTPEEETTIRIAIETAKTKAETFEEFCNLSKDREEDFMIEEPPQAPAKTAGEPLPTQPIKLQTYSGEMKNFKPFWQQFSVYIDQHPTMPAVNKFAQLLTLLRGKALSAVQGLNPTEANYPKAVNLLKERFGNPTKLVAVYYAELANMNQAIQAEHQRANLDEIVKILHNLDDLGVPVDQEYVRTTILQKFSQTTLIEALRTLHQSHEDDDFNIDEMMVALRKAIKLVESVDSFLNKPKEETKKVAEATPKKLFTSSVLVGSSPAKPQKRCLFCGGEHPSQDCRKFRTVAERRTSLIRIGRCFNCLGSGHRVADCNRTSDRCSHCHKTGHVIPMCATYLKNAGTPKRGAPRGMFMQTFTCKCKNGDGTVELRGLLDTGSQHSYLSYEAVHQLKLTTENQCERSICAFGTSEPLIINSGETMVTFILRNSTERNFRFFTTPCITGATEMLPSPDIVTEFLPSNLVYADSSLFVEQRREIDILIGNDLYYEFVTGSIKRLPNNITLINSIFGWVVSGEIIPPDDLCQPCSSALVSNDVVSERQEVSQINVQFDPSVLSNLWSLDVLGIKSVETEENDDLVLQRFRETVRFENGRYVVRWPWKSENPKIPSNIRMCIARLRSLLERSPESTLSKCNDVLKEQELSGIIERAPRNTPFLTHYLSMRPVLKSEKIRLVYDASAKTSDGHSLNSLMHRGPVLLEDLVGLLLNFRLKKIGLIADIEKAFLQIELNEVDRDSVRFVWVKDWKLPPIPSNLLHYRFKRVPFGVIASPFLLGIVLQELLASPPMNDWLLMAKKRFYVDNLVTSLPDVQSAVSFHESLTSRLRSAGFNLRGWDSNDREFMRCIEQNSEAPHSDASISVLGINWNKCTDTITIKLDESFFTDLPISVTKRQILSFLAAIYDPLGLISPSVLDLKLLVQRCWKNDLKWDAPLPTQLLAQWLKLISEARLIPSINIPRTYWNFADDGIYTLHIFCDASMKAYACCAYFTYANQNYGRFASTLIFSKIRLAPLKRVTIPRLELLGVLIGKRASIFLKSKLDIHITDTVLWTDSTTVLQWLNSVTVLPIFVQNRINEIRQASNLTFRYVPSDCNPADIASRGMKAEQLKDNELWWHGPSWLMHKNLWPSMPSTTEVVSTTILTTSESNYSGILDDRLEKRFPSWNSYVRIFMHIFTLGHLKVSGAPSLTATEKFQEAERRLILELQKKYFPIELAKLRKKLQPNVNLDLFLDESGFIRCKGRLQNIKFPWDTIHPILLPRNSPLTNVYIRNIHIRNHHIGCNHLLAKIRERFWIIKGRAKVKSIIHKCVICKTWEGGSYKLPPLPPMLMIRVAEASPFLHTGLDYLGPVMIENDHGNPVKAYICLFVCLVTRAIHLELVNDLTADQFLMGLIRFTSRRGMPKYIISDNATNFVFVQPLVGKRVKTPDDYAVDNFLSSNNICWKFIPQYAPWYGGAYERLVSLVKRSLKKSYGRILLNYVELNTALCHIEDVINSRPLTYLGEEVLQPLTPNHFLRIRTCNIVDSLEVTPLPSNREHLLEAYGHVKGFIEAFWDAFRSLYLLSLRERHTMVHPSKKGSHRYAPKRGDIVLVKEPSAPRSDWKYGVIKKLDKREALAYVSSGGQQIIRAVNQLYPLELSVNVPSLHLQPSTSRAQP